MATFDKGLHEKYYRALGGQSLGNVLPFFVSKYGLSANVNYWSYIRDNPQDKQLGPTGGAYGTPKESWEKYAGTALKVLGGRGYAPGPKLETTTPEEAKEAERKRVARRRGGRARTVLTGSLEPETTKKTLLG